MRSGDATQCDVGVSKLPLSSIRGMTESASLRLRRRLADTPAASAIALPARLKEVGKAEWKFSRDSVTWLLQSKEHTNYTYDLTDVNIGQLEWFIANMTGRHIDETRGYFAELRNDIELAEHVAERSRLGSRRRLADPVARWGRRLGWYALVRSIRPSCVVETGTDKGLGSLAIASALLRNHCGYLVTIDLNPTSGWLIADRWASVIDRRIGDSLQILSGLASPVDMFLHDSLHTVEHESEEYRLVEPKLTSNALVLSDNAEAHPTLMRWAEQTGRRYSFFREEPSGHWYGGGGIGAAYI